MINPNCTGSTPTWTSDREQHRGQNGNRRNRFQKAADYQQQGIDQKQDRVRVGGQCEQGFREGLGDPRGRQDPSENRGTADNDQNHGSRLNGVHRDADELPPRQRTIDHEAEKQRPDAGGDGGFRGRENAEHHAAENDDRRHQRHPGELERHPKRTEIEGRVRLPSAPMGIDEHHAHQDRGHEQPRHDARGEELADRNSADDAVDHHRQRRRNDRPDRRGRRREADGEIHVIAMIAHGLDLDRAEAAGIGDGGAGHAGKDHRAQHVDVAETALGPPHHGQARNHRCAW